MEGGRRSGEPSGVVVKKRSSSGCLIVKKKCDGAGEIGSSSSGRPVFESRKEKKRSRMVMSDSGSSNELLMHHRTKVGPETIHRHCNGVEGYARGSVEESEFGRKRDRAKLVVGNKDCFVPRSGEDWSETKRNRLDVFEFEEDDESDHEMMMMRKRLDNVGVDFGRKKFPGSTSVAQCGIDREYGTGSSRDLVLAKRKKSCSDKSEALRVGGEGYKNRYNMSADESEPPISSYWKNYMGDSDSDEPIRVQGKNGVLKVMVNKRKKIGGVLRSFTNLEAKQTQCGSKIQDTVKTGIPICSPTPSRAEDLEKPGPSVRARTDELKLQKSLLTKKSKGQDQDSEDSDMLLRLGKKNIKVNKNSQKLNTEGSKTSQEQLPPPRIKDGKVRRGSGTEKQRLRERIRGMLLEAGWTIDYRPRRNRDYLDAVYINPSGTAYWSIIKAYDALLKQLNDDEDEAKPSQDGSAFTPISDEILCQLTRKTKKKVEKEMKKKRQDSSDSDEKEVFARKSSSTRHQVGSEDSDIHGEKLNSFVKSGAKSLKNKTSENGLMDVESKSERYLDHQTEKQSTGSNSHRLHGRKSDKLGRCMLLVRSSNEGKDSETDGSVSFSGKRTLLSWLIDCGTVQLSQKVIYMNRRQTRVMLEGWITRDGIHCGCCSKILTVSKFEIHAGSKLRQPFQNIYLDSGVSLLQCQIDAWNRQEGAEHIGFHDVDIDDDDPNDDACGICGDGGDLICCDSCPSTFHQNCLDIEMLPLGDWHCQDCTCKFCGAAVRKTDQPEDSSVLFLTCSMCEKKYHKSCIQEVDALSSDTIDPGISFCGQKCKKLFEHLQKYVGVKNELEAGFSWSLIHRTNPESNSAAHGLAQTVESNSKLAVALTVIDECFLPIADTRSGINLVRNVLYNCGSNLSRLNFGGFFTAILERGDEIISAASIRFHGSQLAEMPFIGTRHTYRHQGMCRRLFNAIESALQSLTVEKLVIPAIADFRHAWTKNFGFRPLEHSLKIEMRSMNMLVFPGIDMLQKDLLVQENLKGNSSANTVAERTEIKALENSIIHEVDCSAGKQHHEQDDNGLASADSCTSRNPLKLEDKPISDSPVKDQIQSCEDVDADMYVASGQIQVSEGRVTCADTQLANRTPESTSEDRCQNRQDIEDTPSTATPDVDNNNVRSVKEADMDCSIFSEDSPIEEKSAESPSDMNCRDNHDTQSVDAEGLDNDVTCLEHVPSSAEMTEENISDKVKGIPGAS